MPLHCKHTKKYSHCQYRQWSRLTNYKGFFILELVYTVFIVTCFFWIAFLYIALIFEWQQQSYNRLIALNLAQDSIEKVWIKDCNNDEKTVIAKGSFTIELRTKRYPMPQRIPRFQKKELSVEHIDVCVLWPDQKGSFNSVQLQSDI